MKEVGTPTRQGAADRRKSNAPETILIRESPLGGGKTLHPEKTIAGELIIPIHGRGVIIRPGRVEQEARRASRTSGPSMTSQVHHEGTTIDESWYGVKEDYPA